MVTIIDESGAPVPAPKQLIVHSVTPSSLQEPSYLSPEEPPTPPFDHLIETAVKNLQSPMSRRAYKKALYRFMDFYRDYHYRRHNWATVIDYKNYLRAGYSEKFEDDE